MAIISGIILVAPFFLLSSALLDYVGLDILDIPNSILSSSINLFISFMGVFLAFLIIYSYSKFGSFWIKFLITGFLVSFSLLMVPPVLGVMLIFAPLLFLQVSLIYLTVLFITELKSTKNYKKLIIALLILLQINFILLTWSFFLRFHGPTELEPQINQEDIEIVPKLNCLEIKSSAPVSSTMIYIQGCEDIGGFKIKDSSGDYSNSIISDIDLVNETMITTLNGVIFSAHKENNYRMEIPLEFNDSTKVIINLNKISIKDYTPSYTKTSLLLFSPTILLILILIIWRVRKIK